ncbi:GNAT family N-acetyltransferase [uncultured Fusobacterium sp.]|uniref:GNAT family N-acetyltransferase n=1 Tax=uncultured Fusobacterium sp. TaxID=159267 RepID=UPI0025CFCD4D|nr:GNAT family N-acetyltransferase [uncultured Fusobacterium sp.]
MFIKRLNIEDVESFLHLRLNLFYELQEIERNDDVEKLKNSTMEYYLKNIDKTLITYGVIEKDKIVSIGSLCLFERIPYIENLSGKEGYILNIYTLPEYRKKGYGKEITKKLIEYSKDIGIKRLWLNTSNEGKKLYSKLGFKNKENKMEIFL